MLTVTRRSGALCCSVISEPLVVTTAVPDSVKPVEQLVNWYRPVVGLNWKTSFDESSCMQRGNEITVTVKLQTDVIPEASVAEHTTPVTPTGNANGEVIGVPAPV